MHPHSSAQDLRAQHTTDRDHLRGLRLGKLPFTVQCIQTDNGGEFGAQFHWHVLDKVDPPPLHSATPPYLNGKSERSHRIEEEEFYRQLEGVVISNLDEFNERLAVWETLYNYDRPHGSLDGQTPYERLRERLQL